MKVPRRSDRLYGLTHPGDKPTGTAGIAPMTAEGLYPEQLWGEK